MEFSFDLVVKSLNLLLSNYLKGKNLDHIFSFTESLLSNIQQKNLLSILLLETWRRAQKNSIIYNFQMFFILILIGHL